MADERGISVYLRKPHLEQQKIKDSSAKRKVVRSGRRAGKTVIAAEISVEKFLEGRRVLYAAPTSDQLETWWYEIKTALADPIEAGIFKKNETGHVIERSGTRNRLRGKTAWNADTLRGDYADFLILDEFQLMNEDSWEVVGAPMLLDNNGDAMFIYTPPALHSRSVSKAKDPRYASKLYEKALQNKTGRWSAFTFTSFDNPHISRDALDEIINDMTEIAYKQEILAQDIHEAPGALWTYRLLEDTRVDTYPDLARIVVGVDPPGGVTTECGIVVAGKTREGEGYILGDLSTNGLPSVWANRVIDAYVKHEADVVVGEDNYGGEMVKQTILQVAKARGINCRYKPVHATRGKAIRAEPIVAAYEMNRAHHTRVFHKLEEELVLWVPGESNYSPNRLDALVWAMTELDLKRKSRVAYGGVIK